MQGVLYSTVADHLLRLYGYVRVSRAHSTSWLVSFVPYILTSPYTVTSYYIFSIFLRYWKLHNFNVSNTRDIANAVCFIQLRIIYCLYGYLRVSHAHSASWLVSFVPFILTSPYTVTSYYVFSIFLRYWKLLNFNVSNATDLANKGCFIHLRVIYCHFKWHV